MSLDFTAGRAGEFANREWQHSFLRMAAEIVGIGGTKILADVCPAAGKTRAGTALALVMMDYDLADIVIVLAPTIDITKGWQRTFAEVGISVARIGELPTFKQLHTTRRIGIVLTYQALAASAWLVTQLRALCERRRTVVILDEIHHSGEGKAWGETTGQAFVSAVLRVGLSATMFRHDDVPIPLLDYHGRVGIPHFAYTYGEALRDRIVRAVVFRWFGGAAIPGRLVAEGFSPLWDFSDSRLSIHERRELLRETLSGNSELVQAMVGEASAFIAEIRQKHLPNAGVLHIRSRVEDARHGFAYTQDELGEGSVLATSSDESVEQPIDAFRHGDMLHLHSVGQIKEGVDIPRLMVLVYMTSTRTQLAFAQAIGRVLRIHGGATGGYETAHVICYFDPQLVKFAERLERETTHVLESDRKLGATRQLAEVGRERADGMTPAAAAKSKALVGTAADEIYGVGFTANGLTADEEFYEQTLAKLQASDLPDNLKEMVGKCTRLELAALVQIATHQGDGP